jgi:hypothetical protein
MQAEERRGYRHQATLTDEILHWKELIVSLSGVAGAVEGMAAIA